MDAELLDDAIATALNETEISAAVETLSRGRDPQPLLDELAETARSHSGEVETAAREELGRLAAAERDLDAAVLGATTKLARRDGDTTDRLRDLERRLSQAAESESASSGGLRARALRA
jgi:hypothetical protein